VIRQSISWWLGAGRPPRTNPLAELYITLAKFPGGAKPPVEVALEFAVHPSGRVFNCEPADAKTPALFVKLACEQLMTSFRPQSALDGSRKAVASVQGAAVLFDQD
jgi:hypothetical protein